MNKLIISYVIASISVVFRQISYPLLTNFFRIIFFTFLLLNVTTSAPKCSAEEKNYYGDTPKDYAPYNRFSEPYKQFFLTPNKYYGYGREIAEPTDIKEIKIGFLGPIEKTVSVATGGVSTDEALGVKMLQGAELAIAHANQQGGYRGSGVPYTLVVKNDNGLWGSSANEIVKLAYRDRVWAVLGTIDGANSHIAIRAALKAELSVVNSGDTDPSFTETAIPWAFRNITDDRQMCYLLADHVFKTLNLTKVAALRANSRYGRIGIDEFRDAAVRSGTPFIIEINYLQEDTDFSEKIKTIARLNPDAIMTYGSAEQSAILLNQIREQGMDVWFIGSDRIISEKFISMVNGDLDKVIAAYPYNPQSNDIKYLTFKKSFLDKYGSPPELFASHSYDGIQMIIEAIEKAGLNRAKIRDELAALKSFHGVSGHKIFDPIFNNLSAPVLATGKGRSFIFYSQQGLGRP